MPASKALCGILTLTITFERLKIQHLMLLDLWLKVQVMLMRSAAPVMISLEVLYLI